MAANSRSHPAGIPTTLLTGFLGAGKTTYLNKLLSDGIAANSLVLVNDFGKINVDAALIEYQDEHIIRLNNGCVCCTLGGSMAEKLAEIGRLTPAPSALYIETSGVANARLVADMIRVSSRFILKDVWCFVDVSAAKAHYYDERVNAVWMEQIRSATQLVLNRLENQAAIPEELAALTQQSTAQIHYDYSQAPIPLYTPSRTPAPSIGVNEQSWHSTSFESTTPIDIEQLKRLITEASNDLYRAKGVVLSAPEGRPYVLQYTSGQWRLIPSASQASSTQLVFIGGPNAIAHIKQQLGG